jgi:PiT family inorganic phosphate transporter
MFLLRRFLKKDEIFQEPHKHKPPPTWIRSILIVTCTLVSFFHGSNDGQKGVGLVMLILIGIVPAYFALDQKKNPETIKKNIARIEQTIDKIDAASLTPEDKQQLSQINLRIDSLNTIITDNAGASVVPADKRLEVRRDILLINKDLTRLITSSSLPISRENAKTVLENTRELRSLTDYAPTWVIFIISLSLGLGTMVGWKRIVRTIGEKIGKQHLTYAQGASAELVAASTIGISTGLGLPVSTTHVLSSGIAGSMVASKGIKNLQPKTVKNIALAWLLTLPVTISLSGLLYALFRWLF